MNGFVLIDKPRGCTSHDVVNQWRRLAGTKRVGHLGTLDPMATGLLVLMTGNATRLAKFFGKEDKTYLAEITFGLVSNTYDAEGDVTRTSHSCPVEPDQLCSGLTQFRGRFLQTPPPVSAKKVNGVRAYKLARANTPVELRPVEVNIKRLEVCSTSVGTIELIVTCTAGTYIRSLAHDLGQVLGCGALLSKLRRLQSGEFTVDQAHTLDALKQLASEARLPEAVIPSGHLLPQIPAEYVDLLTETHIRQGRDFRTSPFVISPGAPYVRALSRSGDLIAVGELRIPNVYHPSTVL